MSSTHVRRRLAVVFIVKDAADSLRLSLASIREVADEIVVVDTGSTDRSREVAGEFGATVVSCAWQDDFSAARNFALPHVTAEWLLWLDAGETLSDEDAVALKQFVEQDADRSSAYLLLVRLPPVDYGASPEQVARVRLMPHVHGLRFQGRIGETPLESIATLKMGLSSAPFVIRRGDRELDARFKKQRAQRNVRIGESALREKPQDARLWTLLGESLVALGENARAIPCFRQALTLSSRGSIAMLDAYYGLLTALGSTPAERDEQLQECIRALEIYPVDAQLLCALGGYLQSQGKLELAGQSYRTAYQFGQVTPTVWHLAEIREIAGVCHALTLQLRGQEGAATEFLEAALAEHPAAARIRRRLIELLVQQGARDSALAHVGQLPKHTPHLEALRSAVRGACFALQQNLIAAKAYLNAAYAHGCRDPLCLKWLALCLISAGDKVAARPILEEWRVLEPRNPEMEKLAAACRPSLGIPGSSSLRIDSAGHAAGGSPPLKLNLPAWAPPTNT